MIEKTQKNDKKLKTIEDLNACYQEAEQVDQDLFAEQRSNILLVAGEHYSKKGSRYWSQIRSNKEIAGEQKLRITKNHISTISKTYQNEILQLAPSVMVGPRNEKELQDQKSAELHQGVWIFAKDKYGVKKRVPQWAQYFVDVGEVYTKIFWDPYAGKLKGYEQEVDENGQPQFDETGNPAPSKRAVFTGALVYEHVFGFNLLRCPQAKSMEESPYVIIRKMVSMEDLKIRLQGDEDKLKLLEEGKDETYVVFDGQSGQHKQAKGQCMLREHYYRPCPEYPNGYFYIATQAGILWQGELPFGIWPIAGEGFDDIPTSPRARSIIKQLRPVQAEINRAASKIAETQITIGDDKVYTQAGTKLSPGTQFPGIRHHTYTGAAPTIVAGRSGDQFLPYLESQISELYRIAMVDEEMAQKDGQLEPYTMLFRSARHKKRFSKYAEKFERFMLQVCQITLELLRKYLPEDELVMAVGKNERVNIAEFKNSTDMGYLIKLEAISEDMEAKIGKQLALNTILQYAAPNLSKQDLGKVIRNMPYTNKEAVADDLTLDYDNATNDILALDRGELPLANINDDHKYVIKRLTHRMRLADFKNLSPKIQQTYQQYVALHQQMEVQQLREIQLAQSGFIPSGGYLVTCDFYQNDPSRPGKTRRARLPYQALDWLVKKLEQQGLSQDALAQMEQGIVAGIASKLNSGAGPAGQAPMPQQGMQNPAGQQVYGQEMPEMKPTGQASPKFGGIA